MTNPPPLRAQHILSFAQSLRGGGVERALLRLAGGWIERGRRVTLLVGDAEGPLADELPDGLTLRQGGGGGYPALAAAAAKAVREQSPDLIFCPGNHYSGIALAARPFAGAPIVAKLSNALAGTHSGLTGWGYARWLALHPRFIDHLVAMTPAMAHEAGTWMHLPANRLSVIPNPPALARPGAPPVPLPPGRFILGVGRLAPQKRWDRLIAATARLPANVSLLILGEGPLRPALETQVATLGLTGRVALPGHAADPLPAMARASVVALTSDFEGVPGAIREALGQGTPVVSTDSSVAIPELIDSPARGTIVGRDDMAALVAALNHWLAPGAVRPPAQTASGDPVSDYLALFDRLVSAARRGGRR
ncbi:glycosyltransferase [Sphingomonas sp.]|uniref:glycosyltransferase n=1 Tax=Sphingomonas sp. TaxID=28214 RepID=UPI002C009FF9|nr:glycosyltransferase [Sphingomonas sp.]HTG39558.1 glycosyltransferase [Sphingomonas sp.]